MRELGIGLIGTGFMGKAHAMAYRSALAAFPDIPVPRLEMVADVEAVTAAKAAHQFGFSRSTSNWRDLVNDPRIDVVSITTPNTFHKEMALAALATGKHVHCEKPLSPTLAESLEMVQAAEKAGAVTQVGFNYIKNPMLKLARGMIEAGELGEITGFRGIHAEDYMYDSESPWTWRLDPKGGPGAIADLGSHIIAMARYLLGPIAEVNADVRTIVPSRPIARGAKERKDVLVDDAARMLVQFGRGCAGTIEASWVSTGRKMQLDFEVYGTKGSLVFTQERMNEMLFYKAGNETMAHGADSRSNGYVRIESGPQHYPYGQFCLAGSHHIGFNDLKTIEMAEFISGIGAGKTNGPDFREAYEVQKVVDAAIASSKARSWVRV